MIQRFFELTKEISDLRTEHESTLQEIGDADPKYSFLARMQESELKLKSFELGQLLSELGPNAASQICLGDLE